MVRLLLFLGFLVMMTQYTHACDTANGWKEWNGSCYYFGTVKSDWASARNSCTVRGADLAVIDSEAEMDYMNGAGFFAVWIGLSWDSNKDDFVWVDGSIKNDRYVSFTPGNPQLGESYCVLIGYSTGTLKGMDDRHCSLHFNYVCEIKKPTTTTKCADLGGECKPKKSHCCEKKMVDDADYCQGLQDHICCLEPGASNGNHTGGTGGNAVNGMAVVTSNQCSPKHQDCCCKFPDMYKLTGNTVYDPVTQVKSGCENNTMLRGPNCPEPKDVCLKSRILNALKCFVNACPGPKHMAISDLYNSNASQGNLNFCSGRCVRLSVGDSCDKAALKSMCNDVRGTWYDNGPIHNPTYTCCI